MRARVHVEATGCRIISDGDAWVDLGAGAATASHALAASCSVVVKAVSCLPRERVPFTVEAKHLFYFSPQVSGAAPDGAIRVEASASSFGSDTRVSFDGSSDYQPAYIPPQPSKGGHAVFPLPVWLQGASADDVATTTSRAGPWSDEPGVPLYVVPTSLSSWSELTMINTFTSKEVQKVTTFDDSLICGQSRTYGAATSMSVDLSLAAFDDLAADLAYFAATNVVFSARVR